MTKKEKRSTFYQNLFQAIIGTAIMVGGEIHDQTLTTIIGSMIVTISLVSYVIWTNFEPIKKEITNTEDFLEMIYRSTILFHGLKEMMFYNEVSSVRKGLTKTFLKNTNTAQRILENVDLNKIKWDKVEKFIKETPYK